MDSASIMRGIAEAYKYSINEVRGNKPFIKFDNDSEAQHADMKMKTHTSIKYTYLGSGDKIYFDSQKELEKARKYLRSINILESSIKDYQNNKLEREIKYKGFKIYVYQNRGGYYYAMDNYGEPRHNPIMFKTEKEAIENQKEFLDKAIRGESVEEAQESLTEQSNYTAEKLASDVKKMFQDYFPESFIVSKFSRNIIPSITIKFALGKNKKEFNNGIIENDPMYNVLHIHLKDSVDESGNIIDTMELVGSVMGNLRWNGPDGMNKIKVPFRKSTGDSTKILRALDKYFSRLKDAVKQYQDDMTIAVPFDVSDKIR